MTTYGYAEGSPLIYSDPEGLFVGSILLRLGIRYLAPRLAAGAIKRVAPRLVRADVKRVVWRPVVQQPKVCPPVSASGKVAKNAGRAGKQARLRELAGDPKLGSADRGWLRQEMNSIQRGQRSNIRNPPGKDLAHERGREAAKGYGYNYSNLQERYLHRLQHRFDDFGRANAERPVF